MLFLLQLETKQGPPMPKWTGVGTANKASFSSSSCVRLNSRLHHQIKKENTSYHAPSKRLCAPAATIARALLSMRQSEI